MGSLKQMKPQFQGQHQTLKLSHIMVMDMVIHIMDIMDIILENDPLMPNLHPKLKANHGMDTMATPAITVTDITTDVKTHNGLIAAQEKKCFSFFTLAQKLETNSIKINILIFENFQIS